MHETALGNENNQGSCVLEHTRGDDGRSKLIRGFKLRMKTKIEPKDCESI